LVVHVEGVHAHAEPEPAARMVVRRLTPRECERLQGFPDDFSRIPWKNKPAGDCPDGPRYKALGNSMAVPVMRWIGRRIDEKLKENK
jgi:DNA (cytosine-5)-methyltransferase 1